MKAAPAIPASNSGSDVEVLGRSVHDPSAFAEIFERHFQSVFGYLVRRVGREDAEDLASQTFVIAFEKRSSFRSHPAGALPWLYGIATNLVSEQRRREGRRFGALTRYGSSAHQRSEIGLEGAAIVKFEVDELARVLEELEPALRDTLCLFAWADLNYEQISLALNVPTGTVASRISRARRFLSQRLNQGNDRQPPSVPSRKGTTHD
jgi:RNA polymerase sigma factor (sigma-70 family)